MSPEAAAAIRAFALAELMDAPPDRKYLISKPNGINLLFEANVILAVQLYMEPKRSYHAFSAALPFGLEKGMSRQDVRALLGPPDKVDAFDTYLSLRDGKIKLIVDYAGTDSIRYISIERP